MVGCDHDVDIVSRCHHHQHAQLQPRLEHVLACQCLYTYTLVAEYSSGTCAVTCFATPNF